MIGYEKRKELRMKLSSEIRHEYLAQLLKEFNETEEKLKGLRVKIALEMAIPFPIDESKPPTGNFQFMDYMPIVTYTGRTKDGTDIYPPTPDNFDHNH